VVLHDSLERLNACVVIIHDSLERLNACVVLHDSLKRVNATIWAAQSIRIGLGGLFPEGGAWLHIAAALMHRMRCIVYSSVWPKVHHPLVCLQHDRTLRQTSKARRGIAQGGSSEVEASVRFAVSYS